MSKYDVAQWNRATYAASSPLVTQFADAWITAQATSPTTALLNWRLPATDHSRRMLVRSTLGVPPDPISGQGAVILSVDATNLADPNFYTDSLTDTVSVGSELFYTMFLLVPDVASASGVRWVLAAGTRVQIPISHGTSARLQRALPSAMTASGGAEVGGQVDPGELLTRVLDGLADGLDPVLTDADRLLSAWDARKIPSRLVPSLVATLGLPTEPALGPKPQRALIANGPRIYSNRGTGEGIRLFTAASTGKDTVLIPGRNMLPSVDTSAYENQQTLTATLTAACTGTTMALNSLAGMPTDTTGTNTPVQTFGLVTGPNNLEAVTVTSINGTTLSVARGQQGTAQLGTITANETATYAVTDHRWALAPSYLGTVVNSAVTGFPMPLAISATADVPRQNYCLAITRANATVGVQNAGISYSARRWVQAFRKVGTVGYVTTMTPHTATVGQQVYGILPTSLTFTPQNYRVMGIVDRYTFVVDHPGLGDFVMPVSYTVGAATPYVEVTPCPTTTLSVVGGTSYAYSAFVRAKTTVSASTATITWYDAQGSVISTTTGSGVTDSASAWSRVSVVGVAPANAVLAGCSVLWTAAWANGETHYITQHQFEAGTSASAYDDGGLTRIGLSTQVSADPHAVLRGRTASLLSVYGIDTKIYRPEFLISQMALPTTSSNATLVATKPSWGDIDLRIRVDLTGLGVASQTLLQAQTSTGSVLFSFRVNTNALELYSTAPPIASTAVSPSTYGTFRYAQGAYGEAGSIVTPSVVGGLTVITSAGHGVSAGATAWLRVTRSATTGAINFYKAPSSDTEPSTWTLVSSHAGGAGVLTGATTTMIIGANDGTGITGFVSNALFYSQSALVASFDVNRYNATTNSVSNVGALVGNWLLSTTAPNIAAISTGFA